MDLISDDYRIQQETLHQDPNYGTASVYYAPLVSEICNNMEVKHLLDYGAGKCRLFQNLAVNHEMTLQAYDPGVKALASDPVPAEMVACLDVLEHIEPDKLESVLDHLEKLTECIGVFTVSCGPAMKVLADGRNAHLIQQPMEWWLPKFFSRFDVQTFQKTGKDSFYVICYARAALLEDVAGGKLAHQD